MLELYLVADAPATLGSALRHHQRFESLSGVTVNLAAVMTVVTMVTVAAVSNLASLVATVIGTTAAAVASSRTTSAFSKCVGAASVSPVCQQSTPPSVAVVGETTSNA